MKQQAFVDTHESQWERFDAVAQLLERRFRRPPGEALDAFAPLYRRVCHHYAMARQRRYSSALIERLHERVLRGHRLLYRRRGLWEWKMIAFVAVGFPAAVRRHWRPLLLATALFWLPGVLMGVACYQDPDLIYTVLDADQVARFESMYDPGNLTPGRAGERAASSDLTMFGYYIYNNVGIGFRTFALGILAGIGTAFVLTFNGTLLGGVAGYLSQAGLGPTFWDFVAGHSAFELTAITISGCAGLVVAAGLLMPGRQRRAESLKQAAKEAVKLIAGAMLMLIAAAFVEAFWSPHHLFGPAIKHLVGAGLWAAVIAYFVFMGRGRAT